MTILNEETRRKLRELNLSEFIEAIELQSQGVDYNILSFEDRGHIEKLKHNLEEVIGLIEKIEDPLVREIFHMKYIEQKSHETIGREVGYSIPNLSRKFRKGIEDLEKLEG